MKVAKMLVRSLVVGTCLLALSGCRGEECSQMRECCAAVGEVEGMGAACGDFAKNVTKPETCRSVIKTVGYMYEDRGEKLPEACRLDAE